VRCNALFAGARSALWLIQKPAKDSGRLSVAFRSSVPLVDAARIGTYFGLPLVLKVIGQRSQFNEKCVRRKLEHFDPLHCLLRFMQGLDDAVRVRLNSGTPPGSALLLSVTVPLCLLRQLFEQARYLWPKGLDSVFGKVTALVLLPKFHKGLQFVLHEL